MKRPREQLGELTKENFHRHYDIDHKTGCWNWNRAIHSGTGYGIKRLANGKTANAHRAAHIMLYGPVGLGIEICHKCKMYDTGKYWQWELAELFKVTRENISRITTRYSWIHI